jgi:hypothetical protein
MNWFDGYSGAPLGQEAPLYCRQCERLFTAVVRKGRAPSYCSEVCRQAAKLVRLIAKESRIG